MLIGAMKDIVSTLFRTTFTDLSFAKKWFMRLAVVGLVGGAVAVFLAGMDGEWTWAGMRAGAGYLMGFVIGATVRLFLKLSLIIGAGVAAITALLYKFDIIDNPMSASDIQRVAEAQVENFQTFVTGYLPSSAVSGLGVASGVTQKPQLDDDTD